MSADGDEPRTSLSPAQRGLWLALLAAAAFVPIGEGLALAALVVAAVCLWRLRGELHLELLSVQPLGWVFAGFGLWLFGGVLALAIGGEGWLKPGELGRSVPMLAIPLVLLAAQRLPAST